MDAPIRLDEDWQVRSTFSDGSADVAEIAEAAEAQELSTVCVADRVRRSSGWIPEFTQACRTAGRTTRVDVRSAVEADVLDTSGTVDVPRISSEADFIFVSARRLPTPQGPVEPEEARERIAAGSLLPAKAVEWLVRASANAAQRYGNVALAHPFSLLPELGLGQGHLHPPYARWLAKQMVDSDTPAVIGEKFRSPELWVTGFFLASGVDVHVSTGSRSPETVGRYQWCREVSEDILGCDRSPALVCCGSQL
jgi:putative hydrolase